MDVKQKKIIIIVSIVAILFILWLIYFYDFGTCEFDSTNPNCFCPPGMIKQQKTYGPALCNLSDDRTKPWPDFCKPDYVGPVYYTCEWP